MNERYLRSFIRRMLATRRIGAELESVPWIRRSGEEFAALVVPNERPETYDAVLDLLTEPACPLRVTREHNGRYDTRIYIELDPSREGTRR